MAAGGRTWGTCGGPGPLHQPVGSAGLQMGKLRFRVCSRCSRSRQELAVQPLQCKRRMRVEPILQEARGPPFSASPTTLSPAAFFWGSSFGSRAAEDFRVVVGVWMTRARNTLGMGERKGG